MEFFIIYLDYDFSISECGNSYFCPTIYFIQLVHRFGNRSILFTGKGVHCWVLILVRVLVQLFVFSHFWLIKEIKQLSVFSHLW